jgi:4'-phosphopantetheinyl transferase
MDFQQAFDSSLPSSGWPLAVARAQIAIVVADADEWRPWLDSARPLLAADERERIGRMRVRLDADTSLLATAMLRALLARVLERPPSALPLWRDGNGKPRVGDDAWHAGIAHAEGRAMVGIAANGPIGVDLEPRSRLPAMAEIAERICHAGEREALDGLPQPQRDEALLALWVRKEAVLKADGIGLGRDMDSFQAPAERPLSLDGSGRRVVARMLDVGAGWMAAVAAPPAATPVVVRASPPPVVP